MSEVRETKLPGVGVRHEFRTDEGKDLAVIVHHDGHREILVYGDDDPDACTSLISLSDHDTHTLGELLGASHVTETVAEVRQDLQGIAFEWIELSPDSKVAGGSIASSSLRAKTGALIVAVIRNGATLPVVDSEFVLEAGDLAVAVGPNEGLNCMRSLFGT